MAEGAPMMYHGGNGFGGPGQVYMVGGQLERPRQYPLEVLQIMGGVAPASAQGTPRRWQPRREHQHTPKASGDSAFGYESDDSSQSSNASGSNKSGEKGESIEGEVPGEGPSRARAPPGHTREWRARRGYRDVRTQRRIAPDRYLNATYPFQVKFTPDDLLNGSKYDTLSQEMWDKFVKSQQTEETFRKKMNLWRYLYITIKTLVPRYGLYVVGSTMSGFGLESSDMDLCLYVRPPAHLEARAHALLHLSHVLDYVRTIDPGAELIQAKVPILKFREARHGLRVDLNCNNVVGLRNTNLLHCFSRMDWRVRPLVAVTKLWAQAHDINDARLRTLSSYSLTLMVIHFLQCGTSPAILPRGAGGRRGRRRTQPRHAGRAVPEHAAVLRRLPILAHGGVGARGRARARGRVPRRARRQERPASVETALCRRAVRPDQHCPLGVRPGDVRQDSEHVPYVRRAPGGRPAPGRRLAARAVRPACAWRTPGRPRGEAGVACAVTAWPGCRCGPCDSATGVGWIRLM